MDHIQQTYRVWMPFHWPTNDITCFAVYRFTMRNTNRWILSSFSRIMISLWDHPHLCNAIVAILFPCFPNSICTCMANSDYRKLKLEWKGKWRDTLEVCSVANPVVKNFSIRRVCIRTYRIVLKTMWNFIKNIIKFTPRIYENLLGISWKFFQNLAKFP